MYKPGFLFGNVFPTPDWFFGGYYPKVTTTYVGVMHYSTHEHDLVTKLCSRDGARARASEKD